MLQVNLGQHVVLSVQQEQAFWWPWTTVPHICSPSPEKFREALKSMDINSEFRKECSARFSNYVDVIKAAIREGYKDFSGWKGLEATQQKPGLVERLAEGRLELCLALSLDSFLLPLLMAQGLSYNVVVVGKGDNNKHMITVYAEKETCCTLQLIWAVSFETKVVELDSLEQLAGLAVAKALEDRGEMGLEELDCAGKQKEVVRLLMDKQEIEVATRGGAEGGLLEGVNEASGEPEEPSEEEEVVRLLMDLLMDEVAAGGGDEVEDGKLAEGGLQESKSEVVEEFEKQLEGLEEAEID